MFDKGQLPHIERVEVDAELVRKFSDEDDFTALAVDLVKEAASYVIIAHSILDGGAGWSRNDAILGGLMVRLHKLISAFLDQVCQKRAETSHILSRLTFETIVDVRFLLRNMSDELADDFVRSSFRQERILRDLILSRVKARGGEATAVERRMLKSVDHAASLAGISLDDVSPKRRDWGGKNTRAKADEVFGHNIAYIGAFAGMSQSVHGSWGDLMQFHLETEDGKRFTPNVDWGHPRPQLLTTLTILAAVTADEFFGYWSDDLQAHFGPNLDDLQARVRSLIDGHENYLAQFQWPQVRH